MSTLTILAIVAQSIWAVVKLWGILGRKLEARSVRLMEEEIEEACVSIGIARAEIPQLLARARLLRFRPVVSIQMEVQKMGQPAQPCVQMSTHDGRWINRTWRDES